MAKVYGFKPWDVESLTPGQLATYLDQDGEKDEPEEAQANAQFEAAAERLRERTGRKSFDVNEVLAEMSRQGP